jgi:hypothetical protein
MEKASENACFVCQKTNAYRLVDKKSVIWRQANVVGLVEDLCGEETRDIFDADSVRVCASCVSCLERCWEFVHQLKGLKRKGSKRTATTPTSSKKRSVGKENKLPRRKIIFSPTKALTPSNSLDENASGPSGSASISGVSDFSPIAGGLSRSNVFSSTPNNVFIDGPPPPDVSVVEHSYCQPSVQKLTKKKHVTSATQTCTHKHASSSTQTTVGGKDVVSSSTQT